VSVAIGATRVTDSGPQSDGAGDAQEAQERHAAEDSGKAVYAFQRELRSMSGTPPPN
jgi:hypothetical protein